MRFILLLFNIQGKTNLGNLIRTANAFGAFEVCVVGRRRFSSYGNQQTKSETKFRHFYHIDDAYSFYKNNGFDFVGVEITSDALSINDHVFSNDTVFIMGNESTGIRDEIMGKCDYCVFVPQFGAGASINVNVACGIVLNAFNRRNRNFNPIQGSKFIRRRSRT